MGTPQAWLHLRTKADYVKHILNKHDGEARQFGEASWVEVSPPASGGEWLHRARFWHYQFATEAETPTWLLHGSLTPAEAVKDLTQAAIDWIMSTEGDNTTLLKRTPDPASGGFRWSIKKGYFITLAELFSFGQEIITCYHLYDMCMSWLMYLYRRGHSVSQSEQAQKRRNAKTLRHLETGRWGLPKERRW